MKNKTLKLFCAVFSSVRDIEEACLRGKTVERPVKANKFVVLLLSMHFALVEHLLCQHWLFKVLQVITCV